MKLWSEREEGQAVVEMALALPVLFLFIFCFMEICLALYTKSMISECAREGTRYAMYHGATCPTSSNPTCELNANQINAYVSGLGWPNLAAGTMTVSTTYPGGSENPGSTVQVAITYTMPITMSFVPASALTLSSTSRMPILQ